MNGIVGTKISERVVPVGTVAGYINDYGAELTGLKKGTPVAPAMLDAEAAMPALGITGEAELMAILGTSSCYIINGKEQKAVKGICGCVKDAVFPRYYTYEAGQSCVGDGYDWFAKNCVPESYMLEARKACIQAHSGKCQGL